MRASSRSGSGLEQALGAYVGSHAQALFASLGRFCRAPLSTLMTTGVIAIALALPTGFLLLLTNFERIAAGWEGAAQISLFVKTETSAERYREIADELLQQDPVAAVHVITPEMAMQEFRSRSGLGSAMDLLEENPLPATLVITPVSGLQRGLLEKLVDDLGQRPEADQVRLDREWVQRLYAIMQLAQRGVWVIAALLAVAVILVVGNTIRLAIENRREEIIITKLIGGTNAFIRRPFLYEGIWYGTAGGLLAALLIELGRLLLNGPARDLAVLYDSSFTVQGLGFDGLLHLGIAGIMLGLLGSWMAVGRHLAAIEPR